MRSVLKLCISMMVVALFASSAIKAEAYFYSGTLQDDPQEVFQVYDTKVGDTAGGPFTFNFKYRSEQEVSPIGGGAGSTDIFYYALLTSSSEYSDFYSLFEDIENQIPRGDVVLHNGALVDILPDSVFEDTITFTAERYLYTFLLVDSGNPFIQSTIHAEYTLELSNASTVPEPSTIILLGAGLMGIAGLCRRKRH